MITFDKYTDIYQDDDIDKGEFDSLLLNATTFLQSYCEEFISQFKLKDKFEDYGLNIDDAIIQQIHFSFENGGDVIYSGQSDMNVTQVSTSGFSFSYGSGGNEKITFFNGIPVSPMAKMLINKELRKKGYLNRWVYA